MNKKTTQSAKVGLNMPVGRIGRFIRKGKYSEQVGASSAVALASIVDYLISEITDLAGSSAEAASKHRVTPKIIFSGLQKDPQLEELFIDSVIGNGGARETFRTALDKKKTQTKKRRRSQKSQSQKK